MNIITVEEAFQIRKRLVDTTGKFSPERTVVQNILSGEYERMTLGCYAEEGETLGDPVEVAKEDLSFLKGDVSCQ